MPESARCSFCGKSQQQVKHLIAGPSAFICDECVELCQEIIEPEVQVQEDAGYYITLADPDRVERLLALMDDEAQEVTRLGLGMDGGEARTIEAVSELVNLTPDQVRQVAFR